MATKVSQLKVDPDLRKALADIVADIKSVHTPLAGVLTGGKTYDAGSLVDAAGELTTVSVPGAALGDFAMASLGVDVQGITVTAYVSAADTVTVRLQNESGGALNLASTTLAVCVLPKSSFGAPAAMVTAA